MAGKFKRLRILFFSTLAVIVLLITLAIVGLLTIDPNQLKPHITKALAEKGLSAELGNLSWRFYPVIGVELTSTTLSNANSSESLVTLGRIVFGAKLLPLLKRELDIETLVIENSELNYSVDAQGHSNWQSVIDANPSDQNEQKGSPTNASVADDQQSHFEIQTIRIANLSVHYADAATQTKTTMTGLNISATQVSTDNQPFPMRLSASIQQGELPPLSLSVEGDLALGLSAQQLTFSNSTLLLTSGKANTELKASGNLHWGENLQINILAEIKPTNPLAWLNAFAIDLPPRNDPATLKHFSGATVFATDGKTITLKDTRIEIDETRIHGELSLTPTQQQPHIDTAWQVGKLNLDRYLAPTTSESNEDTPKSPPQPLPTELLQQLNLTAALSVDELTVAEQTIKSIKVNVKARNGIIKTTLANAASFDATIAGDIVLNAQQPEIKIDAKAQSKGLNVGALLKSLADIENLTGSADTHVSFTTGGKTDVQLFDNIDAHITSRSEKLSFNPINLEQQYCNLVALVDNKKMPPQEWQQFTELTPITIDLHFKDNQVTVTKLSAEINRLTTAASGSLNLGTGKFDFPIDISLTNFTAAKKACAIIDEKWRDRTIPLRCKGSIDNISYDTCTPDMKRIGDIAEQRFKAEKKKLVDKAEAKANVEREKAKDKVDSETKKLLDKHFKGEKPDNALKKLLNR